MGDQSLRRAVRPPPSRMRDILYTILLVYESTFGQFASIMIICIFIIVSR